KKIETWKDNPFSTDNNEYYLIDKLKQLKAQKNHSKIECNILKSGQDFLNLLINNTSKIDSIKNELGLDLPKNKEVFEEYVSFLISEEFYITDDNTWITKLINHLKLKLRLNDQPTIHDYLVALHNNARVPIIPFYFLMLGDPKKELKEQIVFPMLH